MCLGSVAALGEGVAIANELSFFAAARVMTVSGLSAFFVAIVVKIDRRGDDSMMLAISTKDTMSSYTICGNERFMMSVTITIPTLTCLVYVEYSDFVEK